MKKIKRYILPLLTICCLFMLFSSCSDNNTDNPQSTVTSHTSSSNKINVKYFNILPNKELKNDYIICANKGKLEIIKGMTMMSIYRFDVISDAPLDDGDINVEINTPISYELLFDESVESNEKFDRDICLQYNGFDWKKYNDLKSGSDQEEYIALEKEINEEYASLTDGQFPHYYVKKCCIQFNIDDIKGEQVVNDIKVIVKDKKYDVNIGEIKFKDSMETGNVGEYDLEFSSIGIAQFNIFGEQDGIIHLPPREATVKKDIRIKDISLINESETISVHNVSIDIMDDEISINQAWQKGKTIELTKNSQVAFNFEIKDTEFENISNYAVNIYIMVTYESSGETFTSTTQAICECNCDTHSLYAIYNDGINFDSYYSNSTTI